MVAEQFVKEVYDLFGLTHPEIFQEVKECALPNRSTKVNRILFPSSQVTAPAYTAYKIPTLGYSLPQDEIGSFHDGAFNTDSGRQSRLSYNHDIPNLQSGVTSSQSGPLQDHSGSQSQFYHYNDLGFAPNSGCNTMLAPVSATTAVMKANIWETDLGKPQHSSGLQFVPQHRAPSGSDVELPASQVEGFGSGNPRLPVPPILPSKYTCHLCCGIIHNIN
jgi:hypothetical protein